MSFLSLLGHLLADEFFEPGNRNLKGSPDSEGWKLASVDQLLDGRTGHIQEPLNILDFELSHSALLKLLNPGSFGWRDCYGVHFVLPVLSLRCLICVCQLRQVNISRVFKPVYAQLHELPTMNNALNL